MGGIVLDIQNIIKVLLDELGQLVQTKSVVGDPIQAGDSTLIPVSRISFGFGGGGGSTPSRKSEPGEGSGVGGGAHIEPIAFIVIHDGKAQLLNLRDKEGFSVGKVVDLIPEILEKMKGFREKKGKGEKSDAKD